MKTSVRGSGVPFAAAAAISSLLCFGSPASAGFTASMVELFGFVPASSLGTDEVGSEIEYDAGFDFIDIADNIVTLGE